MKIIGCSVENFSSYKRLEFNFTDQGLTLIQGPTGAGKSTLCDVVPWVLFGKTSKGGSVDEVLSWPGDEVTYASVSVALITTTMHIHRTRGPKAKDNDLWWTMDSDLEADRGKDLLDTQRLINDILGMTYETYLAAAYYHEFSQTAQFFVTTAKNRRQITEQLVDLSLPVQLQDKSAQSKKNLKPKLDAAYKTIAADETRLETTKDLLNRESVKAEVWTKSHLKQLTLTVELKKNFDKDRALELAALKLKLDQYEDTRYNELEASRKAIKVYKDLIEELPDTDLYPKCESCGQQVDSPHLHKHRIQESVNDKSIMGIERHSDKIKEIKARINPYTAQLSMLATYENNYDSRLKELENEVNPHTKTVIDLQSSIEQLAASLKYAESIKNDLELQVEDLNLLQEVLADYRSTTIRNSINMLQQTTNKLLSDHFDAEIRVEFSAQEADNLEVAITKNGNACTYTQLSKGQRCLLKLCFGVSVMQAAANHNGLQIEQVFFDEALDGLSEEFKVKAFGLLQTIAQEYSSVFVVEHSETLKSMFLNSYQVNLVNGHSILEKS